jgi:flagellar hook-associated protein 1 FlgK
MSIPSLTGVNTALSGLEADQAALDTIGNNIDNASTPGYTEEVVNLNGHTPEEIPAQSFDNGDVATQLGTGVDVASITRQRNSFLDVQYRAQNTVLGFNTQNATSLGNAQTAFAEPSSNGLSGQLATFWSDWNTLANNPTSLSAQQALVDDATTVTKSMSGLYSQLSSLQSQATTEFNSLTGTGGQLEADANQIASLNGAISNAIAAGQTPNELEDQRDSAIDDLSSLGQVSITNQTDGSVTVNFGDAASPLVAGTTVTWPQTITSATGGQLGALLDTASATGQVGGYMTSLNTVASDLASTVNAKCSISSPFFSGTTASTIAVVPTPGNVQTSSTNTPGGNDVAEAIAALQGGTADQAYQSLVTEIGSNVQAAQTSQSNSQAIVTAFQNQRESADGVSLDQEMTNMITFQRGYQASAQALNTMEQVLGTLISQVGAAGM